MSSRASDLQDEVKDWVRNGPRIPFLTGTSQLPQKSAVALDLLYHNPGAHGHELVTLSGGSLVSGTTYVLLGRLESQGLVERVKGGKRFRLTEKAYRLARADFVASAVMEMVEEA